VVAAVRPVVDAIVGGLRVARVVAAEVDWP
jgi:hypothetical protein